VWEWLEEREDGRRRRMRRENVNRGNQIEGGRGKDEVYKPPFSSPLFPSLFLICIYRTTIPSLGLNSERQEGSKGS
jgi:hypothetical protein